MEVERNIRSCPVGILFFCLGSNESSISQLFKPIEYLLKLRASHFRALLWRLKTSASD